MFPRWQRSRRSYRSLLAWLGFVLMVGSFTWLQITSVPRLTKRLELTPPTHPGPFAVVVIDAGHGGQDSGTVKAGMVEKDLTLDVARRVERLLQQRGLITVLTRADDTYVSLQDRANIGNNQPESVFVSIHFDDAGRSAAKSANGIETYYATHPVSVPDRIVSWLPFLQRTSSTPPNVESESLAGFVQQALIAHTQAADRGTRAQQFYVIANVRQPAVLVEGGFLTNKDEVQKLANAEYREELAIAISDGVMQYRDALQIQRTPMTDEVPNP
ncbi:MAG: N-acetylmuramoyl-L-alanine amidase [Chthoniobacterales bacterium]